MKGTCSTGQSPQWAVVPVEEEEEGEEEEEEGEEEEKEEIGRMHIQLQYDTPRTAKIVQLRAGIGRASHEGIYSVNTRRTTWECLCHKHMARPLVANGRGGIQT
jgi:hypothetical protein